MTMNLHAPVVILVRPQLGENIGMAARAMANFGLMEMRLVAPRDGWGEDSAVYRAAYDAAVGANVIIRQASLYGSLKEAVHDLQKVYATTARERDQAKPVLSAEGFASEATFRMKAGQRTGLVFGPERTGLDNDDISIADTLVSFVVSPTFSSLNLAQSVSLVAYEWLKAQQGSNPPFQLEHVTPPATREMIMSFFEGLEQELDSAGYFLPAGKKSVMVRNLRNIFHRMELTEADVRTLRGVMSVLAKGRHKRVKDKLMNDGVRSSSI